MKISRRHVSRRVCNAVMLNEPKVETSSDLPRKSSANFLNLQQSSKKCSETFVCPSNKTRTIFGNLRSKNCSEYKKLLEGKKIAQDMKSCQKVASNLWTALVFLIDKRRQ